jgi:hypothetical protein
MKNGVFWGVTPCGSCKNRRFGGTWRLLHQGDKNRWTRNTKVFLRSVRRSLVTTNVVSSSPILVTLMKEALSSSETLVLTRATRCNIPEYAILNSHRRENLKSYKVTPFKSNQLTMKHLCYRRTPAGEGLIRLVGFLSWRHTSEDVFDGLRQMVYTK